MGFEDKTSVQEPVSTSFAIMPQKYPTLPEDVLKRFPSLGEWQARQQRLLNQIKETLDSVGTQLSQPINQVVEEVEGLNVTAGELSASIKEEQDARVEGDTALAFRASTLEAQVAATSPSGLLSRITTIEATYATDGEVAASISTALTAAAADAQARVNIEAVARVSADNGIYARWGVAIDINGRVVGRVHLDGSSQTSTFLVAADNFVVQNGNGTITLLDIRSGGAIVFGATMQSDNFDGTNGWRLTRAGNFYARTGTFSGDVVAGTINIDDDGSVRIARSTFQNTDGGTRTIGFELGFHTDKDTTTFIDFHAQAGVDNNARIIRNPGADGEFQLQQQGNGNMVFYHFGGGDIHLYPTVGNVRFGDFWSLGGETIVGYIPMKDNGGTPRKLAVIA